VVLGLEPNGDRLRSDPVLPPEIIQLGLTGIRGRFQNAEVPGSRG
jgi:hypothetical protein